MKQKPEITLDCPSSDLPRARADSQLEGCYGAIGISAVAAAMRYQSGGKNRAHAPVTSQADAWTDLAA